MPVSRSLAAVAAVLLLAACAEPETAESVTAAARESFGKRIAPYQDHPSAQMIADLGPPDQDTPTKEGGRKLVWERHDTKTIDDQVLPITCSVTALTNSQDVVFFVLAGGNTIYCSEVFAANPS
ncbi:hypothetical protein [Inquilinus sp. Marseille-Q2685]|uniref:hypothetical protein n=1 Tax=Inquilinus sp. Marseille-Q2685 TaxID=2866581 RepID=UPI001CE43089|nr:hypothetical protein [Inquilinus sp. Marseille-Q2685]